MAVTPHDHLWPELRKRGLIGSAQPERLGGGNLDRADISKSVYRFTLPDGSLGKLTLGYHLPDLVARAHAWVKAFPELSSVPLFQLRIGETEVFGETYFDGLPLQQAIMERRLSPAIVHHAFLRVISALDLAGESSTVAARQSEWASWCDALTSLSHWRATDTTFLAQRLLPELARHLLAGPPRLQWTHGDLTEGNLYLNDSGAVRLIDTEFAEKTHFPLTDVARFYALSTAPHRQPGLFASVCPQPGLLWQIHFWLAQIQREAAVNTATYFARWLPHRLGLVRELCDRLFGPELGCPWPAGSPDDVFPSETAQLFWSNIPGAAWTEPASERLAYCRGTTQNLFFRVRNRSQAWRLDPSCSKAASVIHRLGVYSREHALIHSLTGQQLRSSSMSGLDDTEVRFSPAGVSIRAPGGDPQIVLNLPENVAMSEAEWLEIELSTDPPAVIAVPGDETYCIEEARWVDLTPTFHRISGWYHVPNHTGAAKFCATISGAVIASSEALARPDVQTHFHGAPGALRSGFQLDLPRTAAGETVNLMARTEGGIETIFHSIAVAAPPKRAVFTDDYARWAERYDADPATSSVSASATIKFSVLLPAYNTNALHLEQCLKSVQQQHYPNWELCVVDDGSNEPLHRILQSPAVRADVRIKVQRRAANGGIARATNDALAMATGDYVVLLDHDDLMRPHALAEFAARLNQEPDLDAIYSDEDKIDAEGVRCAPLVKPDFSPEFLCGVMYVGHLLCVRSSLARSLGGFDPAFDGVQDYEFFLRLAEQTSRIGHLRRMLYHWRMSPSSSALIGNVKGNMDVLQVRAVQAHLARTGRSAGAISLGGHRVQLLPAGPRRSDDCTAIVLNPNHATACAPLPFLVTPSCDSAGILAAAANVATRFVVIVTAALQPGHDDWLEQLLMLAAEADVGAVGPVLLAWDSTVASAGVILNAGGEIIPMMRGFAADGEGYNGSLRCTREVMAFSGVCIAIRRETLLAAENLNAFVSFDHWAVDLCLTLRAMGKRNLICASAKLKDAGGKGATLCSTSEERGRLLEKWREVFEAADPFYPSLCDRQTGDYQLRTDLVYTPAGAFPLRFYIDVPKSFELPGGYLRMRGWCFSPKTKFLQVRLVLSGIELFGRYGTARSDVVKVYPDATDAQIGFELWAIVPPGQHAASLEFQDAAGTWHLASKLAITAARTLRPLWLSGGSRMDLVHFQLGARPSHAPRKLQSERFPVSRGSRDRRPKFTIVTPSYNQRRYLGETLASVVNQADVHVSYVVQDGGSTDGSAELIEQNSARLAYWESVRDNGQADAIARGFVRTQGQPEDIMAWLNSDDVYLPGALAFVADFFARHPEVDAVYGHRILIDENSLEVGRWFLPPHSDEMLQLNDYVPQETLFWRRRLWDQVGGINPAFKFAMDWDLLLRFIAAKAKIVRLPYFLACFRIHAVQKTSSQIDSLGAEEINVLRRATQGRVLLPTEVESDPSLLRYLRKSAWIEFLWRRLGIRHP